MGPKLLNLRADGPAQTNKFGKFVFKTKLVDGVLDKHKVRLVAGGHRQVDVDINEIYSPVAAVQTEINRFLSLRFFLYMSNL